MRYQALQQLQGLCSGINGIWTQIVWKCFQGGIAYVITHTHTRRTLAELVCYCLQSLLLKKDI